MDRRTTRGCTTYRPTCVSAAFMFGILLGAVIGSKHSIPEILLLTVLATTVFHFTFVKNFSFKRLVTKIIKKGS